MSDDSPNPTNDAPVEVDQTAIEPEAPETAPDGPLFGRRARLGLLAVSLLALAVMIFNAAVGAQRRCESSFIVAARDQLAAGGWSARLEYVRTRPGEAPVGGEPVTYLVERADRWLRTLESETRGKSETLFYDGRTYTRDGAGAWGVWPQVDWPSPESEIWAALPTDATWTAEPRNLFDSRCRFIARSDFDTRFEGLIEIADGGFWPVFIRLVNTSADGAGSRTVETREMVVTPGPVTVDAPQ